MVGWIKIGQEVITVERRSHKASIVLRSCVLKISRIEGTTDDGLRDWEVLRKDVNDIKIPYRWLLVRLSDESLLSKSLKTRLMEESVQMQGRARDAINRTLELRELKQFTTDGIKLGKVLVG